MRFNQRARLDTTHVRNRLITGYRSRNPGAWDTSSESVG